MVAGSPVNAFGSRFFISCFCLTIFLFSPAFAYASKEYPTLYELMESGELQEEFGKEIGTEPLFLASSPSASVSEEVTREETTDIVSTNIEEDIQPSLSALQMSRKVVKIGRVPFMSYKRMMANYKGLITFLRKEMRVKAVRIVTGKNYSEVMKALARGSIDFAWVGPMAYVIGCEKMDLIPIARAKRRTGTTYRGIFITRSDSTIKSIKQVRGKVMGFVDPESASGYLYPLYLFKLYKINPHKDCKKVFFLRKHDAVLAAVLAKKVDVGVCLEDTVTTIRSRKLRRQIRILGKTHKVPSDVVACRGDCNPTLRDAFKAALLKTSSLRQRVNPSTGLVPILEFLPLDDSVLDTTRGVLRAVRNLRIKNKN